MHYFNSYVHGSVANLQAIHVLPNSIYFLEFITNKIRRASGCEQSETLSLLLTSVIDLSKKIK